MEFNINIFDLLIGWIMTHAIRVLVIVVGAFIIQRLSVHFIDKLIRRLVPRGGTSKEDEEKRENTLIQVFRGTLYVLISLIVLMMLLSELGVAIGPVLAAAGVAGVAIGFGAQYLIRDIITGIFILLENQYRVGDVVCFDSTCGAVETISLRVTTLRDLDGTLHHVPHGEVKKVSNLSVDFSRVNIDIGIAYNSNLEKVIEVINKVGEDLANDPNWSEFITKPPAFLRVDSFADSAIMVKILGETLPIKQWDVAGELRKRLKIAFDKAKIEIPFPQRVVHQKK